MLIVNLHGGPGAGKSTLAAALFATLKNRKVSAELVTEVAKEFAWEGRTAPLRCQPYVFGQQLWRIERLRGSGVDVVVTDSPIAASIVYAPRGTPASFLAAVQAYAMAEKALNVFVKRGAGYDPRGRIQTLDQARELDGRIREICGPFHLSVPGLTTSADLVADAVEERLRILE